MARIVRRIEEPGGVFSWDDVKALVDKMLLPECPICEERPSEESDFADITPAIEAGFFTVTTQMTFLKCIELDKAPANATQCIVSLLLLYGEHSGKHNWSSDLTIKCCHNIQSMLCDICLCPNITALICSGSHLKLCLNNLCSKLTRQTWRRYPAAVASFWWIISHVKMPLLGEYLPLVFPPTLLVLDDFDPDNKVLGCTMMVHIINNVTRSELKRQQLDEVLYEALHRLLYLREPELVLPSVLCLQALLTKVEKSFTQKLEMGKLDDCLGVLLSQMEMEQTLKLRHTYACALPKLLRAGGLSLVRWSQRIFRIFQEYLTIEDASKGLTQKYTLEALLWFLQQTWPRTPRHTPQALSCLLRLLYDLTQPQRTLIMHAETRTAVLILIGQCLSHLAAIAPEECKKELKGTESLPFGEEFHSILKSTVLAKKDTT